MTLPMDHENDEGFRTIASFQCYDIVGNQCQSTPVVSNRSSIESVETPVNEEPNTPTTSDRENTESKSCTTSPSSEFEEITNDEVESVRNRGISRSSSKRSDDGKSNRKLCGYLNKFNSRGLIKGFKKRWFVFSENNCKLYYYRSPEDMLPLGEIDISQATLCFDVNSEKRGLFTVRTPGREYQLEAKNRQTCIFWIQELQKWRRHFSTKRTQEIESRTSVKGNKQRPLSGLLAQSSMIKSNEDDDQNNETDEEIADELMVIPVDRPEGEVGENSAHIEQSSKPLAIAQQRFNHLRNQVINSVVAMRHKLPTELPGLNSSPNSTNIATEESDPHSSVYFSAMDLYEEAPSSPSSYDVESPPSPKGKSKLRSLSSFRQKIQGSFRLRGDSFKISPKKAESEDDSCSKCKELSTSIKLLQEELCGAEDESLASREVITVLQRQLDVASIEKDTLMALHQSKSPEISIDLLSEKNQKIVQITQEIQELRNQLKNSKVEIESLQKELRKIKETNEMYEELIHEKDKAVVHLTNEVFDLISEKKEHELFQNRYSSPSVSEASEKALETLIDFQDQQIMQDALQAYEFQNKLLNKEILELNCLRSDAEEREKKLLVKCSEWEARCCQIQSKMLFLLKEFQKQPDSQNNMQDTVSRLLQEAMDDRPQSVYIPSWAKQHDYDELGFNWKWGKEEDLLSTKAANLRQRSEDITNKIKDPETTWRTRWDNYMANLDNKEIQQTFELKSLIRSGIPNEYKGRIWKGCINMRIKSLKKGLDQDYYETLLSSSMVTSTLDPAAKQIELDLLRTLPNNKHYESLDADGIPRLRRILLAYSKRNPVVGYCQGLNRLAAIALLFMEEEDAFWCLVCIVENIMPPDYYSRTMLDSQVDQRVLKDLLAEKLPRLHFHLDQQKVDLSMFTFSWFLTVFVDNIPVETYLRIWDAFLFEGSKVLFRFALAVFKICESDLLQLNDYMSINRYLRSIGERMADVKHLAQIAFYDVNPLGMRAIKAKRAHHLHLVKEQFEALEEARRSIPKCQHERKYDSDSDDD